MGLEYDLDASLVNSTWVAVLLSERDVAGQIPINFVTVPTVSLRAACFSNNVFEDNSASKCISNLLAVGYRRLLVDLYWSADLRSWSLCPVTVPQGAQIVTLSSTTTSSPTATADAAHGTVTAISSSSGSILYELGPYLCSDDLDVSGLIDILLDYFHDMTSELNVYITYLSFNLHAAASAASIDQPASSVSGSQLPTGSEHISSKLNNRLSAYIYRPSQLADERSNLNESWYEVDDGYKPITEYFTIYENSDGTQSTPDGWPSSKFVQLAQQQRLLVEYGSVDPQLENYDLTDGNEVIFLPGSLVSPVAVSLADDGSLDSGCFYTPGATLVSQANSSWAESNGIPIPKGLDETQTLYQLSNLVSNLALCGLSPTLNDTLFNNSADSDVGPYRNISLSSSWAWAIGEPQDAVTSDVGDDPPKFDRCAVMDLSLGGHWRAINCTEERRAACRVGNLPFTWALSTEINSYHDAYSDGCPENTSFAVPRTGLENTFLYRYLLNQSNNTLDPTSTDPTKHQVWLDFNSLNTQSCWVTGGPGASCPYAADPGQLERRTVLVASIAGIIICIITALTLFVKCNANRRNSRVKRVIQGWEYEGVPS